MKTAVFGLQHGDEGKGKLEVTVLKNNLFLNSGNYDAVVRYHGGANAGESYEHPKCPGEIIISHQIPVGVGSDGIYTAFLSGGAIHPQKLLDEIYELEKKGIEVSRKTFGISGRNQVVLLHHLAEEEGIECTESAFGTTKCGIFPVYAHAAYKIGMTFSEFIGPNFEIILKEHIFPQVREKFGTRFLPDGDAVKKYLEVYEPARKKLCEYLHSEAELMRELSEKNLLIAGCQSIGLDVFNGANRFSSSSVTTRLPYNVDTRVGVTKLIQSSVGDRRATGNKKWITYDKRLSEALRGNKTDVDGEWGKTSGRPRDLGYFDALLVRHGVESACISYIAATKIDRLGEMLKITNGTVPVAVAYRYKGNRIDKLPDDSWVLEKCTPVYEEFTIGKDVYDAAKLRKMWDFSELDQKTQDFFNQLGDTVGAPISILSTGPWTDNKIVNPIHP